MQNHFVCSSPFTIVGIIQDGGHNLKIHVFTISDKNANMVFCVFVFILLVAVTFPIDAMYKVTVYESIEPSSSEINTCSPVTINTDFRGFVSNIYCPLRFLDLAGQTTSISAVKTLIVTTRSALCLQLKSQLKSFQRVRVGRVRVA